MYNPVQSQRFRRFFHLGDGSDSCATDKSQKNPWQPRFIRRPVAAPLHLVYTARSNPRLTINLVTSLLGSSRRVARTSLLGCHPGVYHSVKPEIDNNKCLVKLWRRMVNRGRIRSRIRGVFHGNNGGNEAGNRVKTKTRASGKERKWIKIIRALFFFFIHRIYIISRVSTVLLTGHYLIFIVILDSQPSNLEVETTFRPLVPVIFLFRSSQKLGSSST